MEKACSRCLEVKDGGHYAPHPKFPGGRSPVCGECVHKADKQRSRRWYAKNREAAQAAARDYYKGNMASRKASNLKWRTSPAGYANGLYSRAKKSKHGCELSAEWIVKKISAGVCEVTGIPFDFSDKLGRKPFSPSIDRLDITKPYTEENCRMVCSIFNLARSVFEDKNVLTMAIAMVDKYGK